VKRERFSAANLLRLVAFLVVAAGLFAGFHWPDASSADVTSLGAALDQQLSDVYLRQDWAALEKFVAPDYAAFAPDIQWDLAALKREFPKIHLRGYHVERQQIKRISGDAILIVDIGTMQESYDGQDISGRYWTSDVWVRRDGKWLLLVEQEVPLK